MGKYKIDINLIVTEEMAQAMINKATNFRDKFLIAVLYFSGARPEEATLLKKKDISIRPDGTLEIIFKTLKLGKITRFEFDKRVLCMKPGMAFYDIIKKYWEESLKELLLDISTRRIEQIIAELSEKKLAPYSFRHSRMTKLARSGATIDQLMYWKGAKDVRSVSAYIRGKHVEFDKIE